MTLSLPSFSFFLFIVASAAVPVADALPWFEDAATDAGITFRHAGWVPEAHNPWFPEITGGGVCWLDFDGDGWLDLFFVTARYYDEARQAEERPRSGLYRNQGDATFVEVAEAAGVARSGKWDTGCSSADYDADGWSDLFIAGYDDDILFHNEGDGTFRDATVEAGVVDAGRCGDNPCWGHSSAWADADLDGDLDLYLVNYVSWNQTIHVGNGPDGYAGQRNLFWRNEGDGTFVDGTDEANLSDDPQPMHGKGLGLVWFDHDLDGCPDVYIASDQTPASLMHNDCTGRFVDIGADAKVNDAYSGMGVVAGDTSGDGWDDLYKTHYQGEPNTFYVNRHDGTYRPITGMGDLLHDLDYVGWGTGFFDFDNDGDLDVYVANGHTEYFVDFYGLTILPWEQNLLFENEGGDVFDDVSDQTGPGMLVESISRGSAVADYDWDGDLDLAVANLGGNASNLLRSSNVTGPGGHYLHLQLRQPGANRDAIGARVNVTTLDGRFFVRHVMAGSGYLSQDQTALHIGLGTATVVDVEVTWPDGAVETFPGLGVDAVLRLVRGGTVVEDTLAPVSWLALSGTVGRDGWYVSPVAATLSAVDHGLAGPSGVASLEYRLDDGPWTPYVGPISVDEGRHVLRHRATDVVGNAEAVRRAEILVDPVPAGSVASVQGAPASSGWFLARPAVTLEASDAGSGVDLIEHRLDGGPWEPYLAGIAIPEGAHTLEHRAVDVAGNVETVQALGIQVDTEAPQSAWTADGDAAASGWHLLPVTVAVTSTDATSGVALVEVRRDDGAWGAYGGPFLLPEGVHAVRARAADAAGHQGAEAATVFRVDGTPPVTTAVVEGTQGAGGWYLGPTRVILGATDEGSGVARTEYAFDSGPWQGYAGPVQVPDGDHSFSFRSIDVAGNAKTPSSLRLAVDANPPVTVATLVGDHGSGGWFRSPVEVRLAATDAGSGVVATRFQVGDGDWAAYMAPFVVDEGVRTVRFQSEDAAGNVEAVAVVDVRVDPTPPGVEVLLSGAEGSSGWYVSAVELDVAATDTGSGVALVEHRVDGGAWNAHDVPLGLDEGTYQVEVRATDGAGNVAPVRSVLVRIDRTPPTAALGAEGMHLWHDEGLDVVLSTLLVVEAEDAGSGVALAEHRIGDGPWEAGDGFQVGGDDGHRVVAVRARDEAGNVGDAAPVDVWLRDRAPPPVEILRPVPGLHVAGLLVPHKDGDLVVVAGCVEVAAATEAHVSGSAALSIRLDGVQAARWDQPVWDPAGVTGVWVWDTMAAAPGRHLLEAVAVDHLGNLNVTSLEVWSVGAVSPGCRDAGAPDPLGSGAAGAEARWSERRKGF